MHIEHQSTKHVKKEKEKLKKGKRKMQKKETKRKMRHLLKISKVFGFTRKIPDEILDDFTFGEYPFSEEK